MIHDIVHVYYTNGIRTHTRLLITYMYIIGIFLSFIVSWQPFGIISCLSVCFN